MDGFRPEELPVSAEIKSQKGDISQLITKGRKQGYLLFEEIDKTFQDDLDAEESFDDFLSSIDDYGIKILDTKQKEIELKRIQAEIARQEKNGDRDKVQALLFQKQDLIKQILALN